MTPDDGLALFRAHMADCADPVNLAEPDEAEAYKYELERPGDFIEKLSKRSASTRGAGDVDDLDESVAESLFTNPLRLTKGTVGYRKRICRIENFEDHGYRFRKGFDDRDRCVIFEVIGPVENENGE